MRLGTGRALVRRRPAARRGAAARRSPARSPRARASCCSTSRPPGSTRASGRARRRRSPRIRDAFGCGAARDRARHAPDHAALRADPGARLRQDDRASARPAEVRRDPAVLDRLPRDAEERRCCSVDDLDGPLRPRRPRSQASRSTSTRARSSASSARTAPASRRRSRRSSGSCRSPRGTISFHGEPLAGLSPEEIVRRGLALVPEGRHIFATLTVAREPRSSAATAQRDRARPAPTLERVLERFPVLRTYYRLARGQRSPAASSSSSRSPARCVAGRGCSCSTSRRSASRRVVIDASSTRSQELRDEGVDDPARRAERRADGRARRPRPTSCARAASRSRARARSSLRDGGLRGRLPRVLSDAPLADVTATSSSSTSSTRSASAACTRSSRSASR